MKKKNVEGFKLSATPFFARCPACRDWKTGCFSIDEARSRAVEHTRTRLACVVFVIERRRDGSTEIRDIVERRPISRRARA